MTELLVDGSFFEFGPDWEVEKFDNWVEFRKMTGTPYHAKGCDLIAILDKTIWLVEVKDYTYSEARVPSDLAQQVGRKIFGTLAALHAVARWGQGDHQKFSKRAINCTEMKICLSVELPDGGRGLQGVARPLADLLSDLKGVTRKIGTNRPIVSSSVMNENVPWIVRRDPATRQHHADR